MDLSSKYFFPVFPREVRAIDSTERYEYTWARIINASNYVFSLALFSFPNCFWQLIPPLFKVAWYIFLELTTVTSQLKFNMLYLREMPFSLQCLLITPHHHTHTWRSFTNMPWLLKNFSGDFPALQEKTMPTHCFLSCPITQMLLLFCNTWSDITRYGSFQEKCKKSLGSLLCSKEDQW